APRRHRRHVGARPPPLPAPGHPERGPLRLGAPAPGAPGHLHRDGRLREGRAVSTDRTWQDLRQVPRIEPTPRWVRVRRGATVVADSRRALLLVRYGTGALPTYCFPAADVRTDLLAPSGAPA